MAPNNKFPLRTLLALTTIPALLVGGLLWYASSLLPSCQTTQHARLPSPDSAFDLVIFSRDCGATTGANTQAALIPNGDSLPDDAASFPSIGASADLAPRWTGPTSITLTIPPAAQIYRRDDSVAGIAVIYR
ncbi:hypothetical protein N8A98_15465 [Devosia neptuniae]|uniref:Uncharacterized protein n=1 Tax=Devosia neptuniae TaxID=191302 RepID=A0ABY6CBN0_9HYPH|nr:hypothetical protein [Devosia neptuniae]UXN68646.1 hypothetical protein N8A98_15465 [Devosia neptuniae]